jgi:hypothetical protein
MKSPSPAMKKHVKIKTRSTAESGLAEGRVNRPLIVISRILCTKLKKDAVLYRLECGYPFFEIDAMMSISSL